jgi:hypothetical protein
MKTSNIILTAFAALILIFITVALFVTKNKVESIVEQANASTEAVENTTDSIMLEDFNVVLAEGDGRIEFKQTKRNALIFNHELDYSLTGDVLNINPKGGSVILEFKNLRSLHTKDDIRIKAETLLLDSLNIQMDGDARLDAKNFTLNYIEVLANDDARMSFEESKIEAADIILNDDADVYLINTICSDLNFEQNDDSDLSFKGKTKIGKK